MDVLGSRILIRPRDPMATRAFYRDVLGLAVYREFGPPEARGTVFFLGGGFLEVSGHAGEPAAPADAEGPLRLWLQVRDVAAEYDRILSRGGVGAREPRQEPWGLIEAHLLDPDGLRLVVVEVPPDHPLRLDQR